MKYFSFLLLTFCLTYCGHPSSLLEGTFNEASPLPEPPPVDLSRSEEETKDPREELAADLNTNPPLPIPELDPSLTYPESDPDKPLDAFIQRVSVFNPGPGFGYGYSTMMEWLLGPPFGGGFFSGSVDVVSLGNGGTIVLGFKDFFPIDGSGPDFIVFENPFFPIGNNSLFVEPGIVGVSQDGLNFIDFPCSLTPPYQGCAGTHAVLANPEFNTIDPRDPAEAGGDLYDLGLLGLQHIQYVRIRDAGLNLAGETAQGGQSGFDLDAISIVHGAKP